MGQRFGYYAYPVFGSMQVGEIGSGTVQGRLSTKINLVTGAQGQPVRFALTSSQEADARQAIPLLTGIGTEAVIADKGYESNGIVGFSRGQGAEAVSPPKSNRKDLWAYDRQLYRSRNLIERALNKLNQGRRLPTRYDRKSLCFLSALYLAAALTWSR